MRKLGFQEKAVAELIAAFKRLWMAPGDMLPIVFKSPTGSGKTFMTESFIQELSASGGVPDDVAWIWITFSDDLAMQSKAKFEEYFYPNVGRRLLTVADFSDGVLKNGDILFLNWQKLVARDADARILRRPEDKNKKKENGYYFEDVIEATHAQGRRIAMVIDESHKNVTADAERIVIEPANPKVIIKVSATPKSVPTREEEDDGKAAFVRVRREDVVAAGLIKEAIVSQTREEIERGSGEQDLDERLLDLAIRKRDALLAEWQKAGSKVRPLILVQLPDEKKSEAADRKIKKEVVWEYLKKRGVPEENIANWFDSDKELDKLKFIAEPDSPIEFLLFKQAAGTGWDCPRAQILVMYRDIKSPVFKTQTLGRIVRNPEPDMDLSKFPALRKGYLYTNYSSAEVKDGAKDDKENNILTRTAKLVLPIKEDDETLVVHPAMTTDYVSRSDYGDLGKASEFQASFMMSMNKWFGFSDADLMAARTEKVEAKGVDVDPSFKKGVVTELVVESIDDDGDGGEDAETEISPNDAERLFSAKSREMLEVQTDEDSRVGNIARSEGVLRQALRIWLKGALPNIEPETARYKVFLNDVRKDSASVFLVAITDALKKYAPIRRANIEKRKKAEEAKISTVFTLKKTYEYADAYEEYRNASGETVKLSAVTPFLLLPKYNGRENETAFVDFLEAQNDKVEWWIKNGAEGADWFGLKYFNTTEQAERLFYPDWIVKFKTGRIGIFDTKGGMTAEHPEGRETGLRNKIAAMNKATGSGVFFGGLVVKENGQWYCHDGEHYAYAKGALDEHWRPLKDCFAS